MHINSSITIHHSLFLPILLLSFHLEMIMKASSGTTKRLASSHRAKEGARFQLIRNAQLFSNSNDNQKVTYLT
jgi:hypothetical protein